MDTLEQLRRQIDEIQIPPLPTEEEKAQIMKGRKGQADIDAGRKAIQDRVDAYNKAIDRRSNLTTQLADLEEKAGQRKREDEAASPEAMRNKALMVLGPSAFGYGAGYGLGAWKKHGQAAGEKQRNIQRQATAETGPRAARMESATRAGLIPSTSGAVRALGRFAPFGAGAAFFGGDAAGMQYMMDNASTQGEKDIYGAARNLFGGTAAGFGHAGLEAAFAPKVSPDAAALSKILAPDPDSPPKLPNAPMGAPSLAAPQERSFKTGAEARRYATSKGVQLPSKLSASETIERAEQLKSTVDQAQQGSRVGRAISKTSKALLPLTVGALAYDAASSEAEAAGATPGEARQSGLVQGGAAAGGTAAGAYGLGKVLEKAPNFSRALGGASSMMAPFLAADAYDPTPEQLAMDRNWAARNLPEFMQFGAVGQARDMAQVPERNPMRRLPPAPMGFGAPY